ncbi:hypothetical protein JCM3770_003078 [Rhodotorula araucariae]
MLAASRTRDALAAVRRISGAPPCRAAALYLAVSAASAASAALIGSSSEYRFPHPLVSTQLHLLISLACVAALTLGARIVIRTRGRRRALTGETDARSRILDSLASLLPSGPLRAIFHPALSPFALSAALFSTLASLLETRAHRIADPSFFAFARLLPLVLCAVLALILPQRLVPAPLENAEDRVAYLLLWLVFVAGAGVSAQAGRGGWPVALGWAAGATGWVLALQAGVAESRRDERVAGEDGKEGERRRPGPRATLSTHLLLNILLLALPTILSTELSDIRRSRHYAFFLEPGFWVQEAGMALCGLAGLCAFWHLVSTCAPLPVFALVAAKDLLLLPRMYAALLGNPTDALSLGEATLSGRARAVMLLGLGAWLLAGKAEEGEWEGRDRRKAG